MRARKKKRRTTSAKKAFRFRRSLFWDADPASIDPRRHARYIIERILDLGDVEEVRWMARTFCAGRKHNLTHILKSLTYFGDAEVDPTPRLLLRRLLEGDPGLLPARGAGGRS